MHPLPPRPAATSHQPERKPAMQDNIIPLFGQPTLPGTPQIERKPHAGTQKKKAPQQQPTALAAATIISQRQCLVCTRPTGKTNTRYCQQHTGSFWKWLECSEPGCEIVGERKIPGQTIFRCPAHRATASQPSPNGRNPQRITLVKLLSSESLQNAVITSLKNARAAHFHPAPPWECRPLCRPS